MRRKPPHEHVVGKLAAALAVLDRAGFRRSGEACLPLAAFVDVLPGRADWQPLLEAYGFWHGGELCLPFAAALAPLFLGAERTPSNPDDDAEEVMDRLEELVQRSGFVAGQECPAPCRGRTCVPFDEVLRAVRPEPHEPDAVFEAPGGTPERLAEVVARAESGAAVFRRGDDREVAGRRAARLKPGKTRLDRRKHYEVVVETHGGVRREKGVGG